MKYFRWKPSCSMRTDGWTDTTQLSVAFPILLTRLKTQTLIPGIRNNSSRICTFIRRWLLCIPPALSWNNSRTTVTIVVYICKYTHTQSGERLPVSHTVQHHKINIRETNQPPFHWWQLVIFCYSPFDIYKVIKNLFALYDYSIKTRKNILNGFNHLPW
jgi:hypothetical protein